MQQPVPAGDTKLADEMVAALHYWLLASGMPTHFCLVAGFKLPTSHVHLPVHTFGALVAELPKLCGVAADVSVLDDLRLTRKAEVLSAAADSLMYT
jgi:hypothetical protein